MPRARRGRQRAEPRKILRGRARDRRAVSADRGRAAQRGSSRRLGSLDIRAARHFRFSDAHSLSLFVEIANLFNRANDCCVEYEVDDETGELRFETEAVNSLPFIPSAGFIWRF